MPTIIPDTVFGHSNTYKEMTYLKNNNIYDAIRQKLRNKDVYETDMHKVFNIIVIQTNKQLQEKESSDDTFHVVKTVRYPVGYLMILNKI